MMTIEMTTNRDVWRILVEALKSSYVMMTICPVFQLQVALSRRKLYEMHFKHLCINNKSNILITIICYMYWVCVKCAFLYLV